MKRIIDGVTYNTDTSTCIAQSEYDVMYNHENYDALVKLYQTRGGAFFLDEEIHLGDDEVKHRFEALSSDEAQKWLLEGDVEVFDNPFDEPPEAAAEAQESATIYVRVPMSLKKRLEKSAAAEKLSGNAWAMRCIERCLASAEPSRELEKAIGRVWGLARVIGNNELYYSIETREKMAEEICRIIGDNWAALGFAEVEGVSKDMFMTPEDFRAMLKSYPRVVLKPRQP